MGAYIPKGGRENPRGGPFGAHAYIMPHVQCDETYLLGKKDNVVPVVGKMYQPQTQKEKAFLTSSFSQHGNRRRTECVSRWRQPKRHRDMVNNKFKVNWNLDRNGPPGAKSSSNRGRPSPVPRRPSPVARRLSASPRRRPSLRAFLPSLRTAPRGGGRVRRRRCRQLTRRDGLPHHIVHHL